VILAAGQAVRIVEAARQQKIGQPRQQLFEIDVVQVVAGKLRVPVLQL